MIKSVANQRKRDRNRKLNQAFEQLARVVDSTDKSTKKEILSKAICKIDELVGRINDSIFVQNQSLPEGVEQIEYKPVYQRGRSEFQPVTTKEMHIEDDD